MTLKPLTSKSNPNTCDHGYRIETGICPTSGCIANGDEVAPAPRAARYWPPVVEQLTFICDRTLALVEAVVSVRPILDAAGADVTVRFASVESKAAIDPTIHLQFLPGDGFLHLAADLADALGFGGEKTSEVFDETVHHGWVGSLGGFRARLAYVESAPVKVHTTEDTVAEMRAVSEANAEREQAEVV